MFGNTSGTWISISISLDLENCMGGNDSIIHSVFQLLLLHHRFVVFNLLIVPQGSLHSVAMIAL